VNRLIGSGASALVLLGAGLGVVAAPAAAEDPDGTETKLVVLFGNDGSSETATKGFAGTNIPGTNYDNYILRDGSGITSVPPPTYAETAIPADPAWFAQGQNINFSTPVNVGSDAVTVAQNILFTFGSSWSGKQYDVQWGGTTQTLNDNEDSAVYVTKCSSNWDPHLDGEFDVRPTCTGDEYETVLIFGTAPEPDPGSGGGSSSSGSGSSAPMLNLALDPTETDATCSVAAVSGVRGSWVTLEAASDCTPPPNTPDAQLLGWATDPDFPVDIAQRQVDNGWGAYETYNDDGQLTGVFIPAGGATLLSASNTLHAIWSDTSASS